jgi:phenylacetate-coenzyme A ligase PaaK-like adenylate-forming protein
VNESFLGVWREAGRTRRRGPHPATQQRRLADLVAYARHHSPYFRELYRDLPERVDVPAVLPVTSKKMLVSRHYDEWATDRDVTLERARAFVADPGLVGTRFLGRYTVVTTSGTTGVPAIFVKDDRDVTVNLALGLRMMLSGLGPTDVLRVLAAGGRTAVVAATGGHFLVSAGTAHMRRGWLARRTMRVFSVRMPLPDLVGALNDFRPAVVLGYGSVMVMLAAEREAGRLHIGPVLVEPAGETLSEEQYERISRALRAKVRHTYGASECPFLTDGCAHGWYHVNTDWVVAEPVQADYSPTPPGTQSHTILVSNLANRVQPILRYDLGDSVLERPDPCPCGNPLPAIRVQGRSADVLTFRTEEGRPVSIVPLMLGTLADRTPGVELFQIVQTAPTSLRLHLRTAAGADPDRVWQAVCDAIKELLAAHNLPGVRVERSADPPEQSVGGKYRTIIPLGTGHGPERRGR